MITRTLLRKELQQHGIAFGLLALCTGGFVLLATFGNDLDGGAGSVFEGLLRTVKFIVPAGMLLLTQRLVALEFREKTQLFLEALPLPRWRMIAVKYVLGMGVALVLALGALAIAAFLGRHNELLTPRFLGIVAMRSAVWTWFVFSFFFATAFLGRYRLLFYLLLGMAFWWSLSATEFRPAQFGPFLLVDRRFPYETMQLPIAALRTTALLTSGFIALSFVLGLAREGSVAGMLGEKMSRRERFFVAALLVIGVSFYGTFGSRKKREPYDIPGAIEESRGIATVKVALPGDIHSPRANAIGARVADELAALADYLAFPTLPSVFIVLRPDFTASQFERVSLAQTGDLVVRANFDAPAFDERAFLDYLVRRILTSRSHGRLELEPKVWVLDGFALFWKARRQDARTLGDDADLAAWARRGAEKGLASADVTRWFSYRERIGTDEAKAIAAFGLQTLERRHGFDACRKFLRAVLGRKIPHDARATWRDLRRPVARELEDAAGVKLARFIEEWREELALLPPAPVATTNATSAPAPEATGL